MQSLITSHKQTSAQSASKEHLLWKDQIPGIVAESRITWRVPVVSPGCCPGCVPSSLLPTPACSPGLQREGQGQPWHPASAAQQHLKHWCAINTVLVTSPTFVGCNEAINSIPARASMQCSISNNVSSFFLFPMQLFATFLPTLLHTEHASSLITSPWGFLALLPSSKEVCSLTSACIQAGRGSGESYKCILN